MIRQIFSENGICLSDEQVEKFLTYEKLLTEYNKKFNLTSITDSYGIYVKHFLDSVKGANLFNNGDKIIEIGSGGGFPSVPLKIFNPELNFTLIEATGKKCVFLNEVKRVLGFDKFEIINARCEDLAKKQGFRENFDKVTARAVAPMSALCEYCLPFLKTGGEFIAYKSGEQQELSEAERAGKILGGTIKKIIPYSLPQDINRAFIIIEKIFPTDKKYPRGQGKERSKPL